MAIVPIKIPVSAESELSAVLEQAARAPLLLERGGLVFRVTIEQRPPASASDPEIALASMRAAAGSWRDIDPEAFKAALYRAREDGSKLVVRA
ncbi:MAG: hypothetical protein ACR2PL_23685 [Dehalococcoidia bacterium]